MTQDAPLEPARTSRAARPWFWKICAALTVLYALTAFERLGIPQVYAGFGEDEQLRDKHGYGLSATVSALRRALAAR